jgi:hypothetical protein
MDHLQPARGNQVEVAASWACPLEPQLVALLTPDMFEPDFGHEKRWDPSRLVAFVKKRLGLGGLKAGRWEGRLRDHAANMQAAGCSRVPVGPSSSLDQELSTGANRRGGACLKTRGHCPLPRWLTTRLNCDGTFIRESHHGDPNDESSSRKKGRNLGKIIGENIHDA